MVLDFPVSMSDAHPAFQGRDPAFVRKFLKNVRGSVPLAIEQIDAMLQIIAAARERVQRFLILGSGDSLLAAAILDEYPDATGIMIDPSEAMIASASRHLRTRTDRLTATSFPSLQAPAATVLSARINHFSYNTPARAHVR